MDILGYLPNGKFLGIEVKSEIGRPSPEQKIEINKANSNYACAFIARGVWQTYMSIVPFWPEIKTFEEIALQYKKHEEKKPKQAAEQ